MSLIDDYTNDLMKAAGGKTVLNIAAAAALLGRSVASVRARIGRGELRATRAKRNAPFCILAREVARLLVADLENSLPDLPPAEAGRRRARLAVARRGGGR